MSHPFAFFNALPEPRHQRVFSLLLFPLLLLGFLYRFANLGISRSYRPGPQSNLLAARPLVKKQNPLGCAISCSPDCLPQPTCFPADLA